MKPFFICLIIMLLAINYNLTAQMDDFQRIGLNVYVPEDNLISDQVTSDFSSVSNMLVNKLESIVTRNGFTGGDRSPRFSLMPKISVLEKSLTSGAPTLYAYELEIHLFILDYLSLKKYATTTIPLSGVDVSEQKAFLGAIQSISNNSEMQSFLAEGKQKILQYYTDQCDFILKEAEVLASMKKYNDALMNLTQVPQACKKCYDRAVALIPTYFKQYYDRKCDEDLAKAKSLWAVKSGEAVVKVGDNANKANSVDIDSNNMAKVVQQENENTAIIDASVSANIVPEALKYLVEILPDCHCYEEAQILISEIKNSTHRHEEMEEALFELDMELKRDESKQRELAIRKGAEVGVETAKANAEAWKAKQRDTHTTIYKY